LFILLLHLPFNAIGENEPSKDSIILPKAFTKIFLSDVTFTPRQNTLVILLKLPEVIRRKKDEKLPQHIPNEYDQQG